MFTTFTSDRSLTSMTNGSNRQSLASIVGGSNLNGFPLVASVNSTTAQDMKDSTLMSSPKFSMKLSEVPRSASYQKDVPKKKEEAVGLPLLLIRHILRTAGRSILLRCDRDDLRRLLNRRTLRPCT